jgi:anaerobic selenocysteine-containing dehydrogenase
MEHREHGAMQFRTVACLPLLTGAWRDRGGGYCRSVGVWSDVAIDGVALRGPSLAPPDRPPRRPLNMNHLGRSLTDADLDPPIEVLLVWNGNPLVSVPNRELIRRGLEREDLFCVVHEQFLTDTARYADVVLPATTQLEQRDVVTSWGHLYLGWNEPAIAPLGEAVSNTELFRRLARAMGYTDPSLFVPDDELLDLGLAPLADDDRTALRRDGFVRLPLPEDLRPYARGGFATADGRARLSSPELAARGIDPLPTHASPEERRGANAFPLVLLTTKSHTRFLNTSYSHLPKHGPAEGAPRLEITADDATVRGIADGDEVRVWNDRGELRLSARVSTVIRPGVVSIPFGWWEHQHGGGVANSLTNDALTDFGGGVAFHDTRVEVAATQSGAGPNDRSG